MTALQPTDATPATVAGRGGERIGWSDEILPTERTVKFNETEFAVPEAAGPDCIREIRALMRTRHPDVVWPLEYRTLAADEIPLSPPTAAPPSPSPCIRRRSCPTRASSPTSRPCSAIIAAGRTGASTTRIGGRSSPRSIRSGSASRPSDGVSIRADVS